MSNPPQNDGPAGRPARDTALADVPSAADRKTMTIVELRYYEKLRIGNVTIDVAPDQDQQVRIGIVAPREVVVLRQELAEGNRDGRRPSAPIEA